MRLRTKVLIPLLIYILFLLLAVIYGLSLIRFYRELATRNIINNQKVTSLASRYLINQQDINRSTFRYIYFGDPEEMEHVDEKIAENNNYVKKLKGMMTTVAARRIYNKFEAERQSVIKAREEVTAAVARGDVSAASSVEARWEAAAANHRAALHDLINFNLFALERNITLYNTLTLRLAAIAVFFVLMTIAYILFLFFYLRRVITLPIGEISRHADQIAASRFDIRHHVRSNDELGKLDRILESMAGKLKKYYDVMRDEVRKKEDEIRRNKLFEEQKDDFINIASHELKTPVTSLKVYEQFMLRNAIRKNDTQNIRYLKKMGEQTDKIVKLIEGLLDVTRLQGGRMPYSMKHFNLNKLVRDTVEVAQETNVKHDISLSGRVPKNIYGDADRIGQVVDNLISNAVKYSPKGKQILVKLNGDRKQAAVSVQDFGIGIDKVHLRKIFKRFYRVTGMYEKTYPGLGIGLYVCSQIARRHGGRLKVESVKGEGSVFTLTLPYKKVLNRIARKPAGI